MRSGGADRVNVGDLERWISVIGGGLLGALGLNRRDLPGLGLAALGGALIYRGLTGHCHCYGLLGIDTAGHSRAASVRAGHGVKVVRAVSINRPAEELYRFWRNFENLPRIMHNLVRVTTEGKRSQWVARGPMGKEVEWDAEIITEEPNRLIGWRSLEGSEMATAGSVHFTPATGGRGTEVRVEMKYDPPAGKVGVLIAKMFSENPAQQIQEDLRRFKQLMEAGATPPPESPPAHRF
ncbi:MAG: SRPBCC family protein [Gemmataceae bacterium]|nr:SRPBCC family protein [Gemmataceae bacterium]